MNVYPELTALTLVIIIDWFLPFPTKYSPTQFFKLLASSFANKLAQSGSSQQQTLAGWLSLICYLFIILSLVFAVLFIAENDVWTQALLLYLSLSYQDVANRSQTIGQCIASHQKTTARSLLTLHCPYDVDKLSVLGINKINIELITMYFVSAWLMPIVLFVLFDGLIAFTYRAIFEAYIAWLPQKKETRYFGKGVTLLKNILELIPTFLIAPIYSIFHSSPNWTKLISTSKQAWKESKASSVNNLIWLSIVAAGCKSELAGPLMVNQHKLTRPRINQGAQINEQASFQLLHWNNRFRLTILIFNLTIISALALLT